MKLVYVVYDDVIDDADIITVPNDIYQDIEHLATVFVEWLWESAGQNDQEYRITINGKQCQNLETKGFVKWLNNYYCKKGDMVSIVKQHTEYCSEFKCVEF